MDPYIEWLKNTGQTIFELDGNYWRPYQKALIPASLKPQPIELSVADEHKLLQMSGALFLRYFTRTQERPTEFWYTSCNEYSFADLPRKLRTQIRRAAKDVRVERVDPVWLADHGYECYAAAFSRYQNSKPESREQFDRMCRGAAGGPFEFWAALVGDEIAGFGKYVIGDDYVAGVVLKFDPRFLSLNTGTAMQHTTLSDYVVERHMPVAVGFRSIAHDTNLHDFVLKFGYRRRYCDLKVAYRPAVRLAVNLLYRYRAKVNASNAGWAGKVKILLDQEDIRRSFEPGSQRTSRPGRPFLERIVRSVWGNRYGATVK